MKLLGFFALLICFVSCQELNSTQGQTVNPKLSFSDIQPIITPRDFLTQNSKADIPFLALKNTDFVICWVRVNGTSLEYILRTEYRLLELSLPKWKRQAVNNLRLGKSFIHARGTDDKGKLMWICFMNDSDVISSSKIMLQPELSQIFPEGYRITTPNRVVGFVISNEYKGKELEEVIEMSASMVSLHEYPNSPNIFSPEDFELPASMVKPFDNETLDSLVSVVIKAVKEEEEME